MATLEAVPPVDQQMPEVEQGGDAQEPAAPEDIDQRLQFRGIEPYYIIYTRRLCGVCV